MRTSDIKRLGEAYASVVESRKSKKLSQVCIRRKNGKRQRRKEFTFAGKKYNVEDALKEAEVG